MRISGCLALLFLVHLLPGGVTPLHAAGPLEIELVSSVKAIQPGKRFHLGLALRHAPGSHTYWKHPGIVGLPTRMEWKQIPAGCEVSAILWPAPERTRMLQVKAQGYERDVVLPVEVIPPSDLVPGSAATFRGLASWMCCDTRCHPGFRELSITLPVAASEVTDPAWSTRIAGELASRARESSAWAASSAIDDKRLTLTLRPLANARPVLSQELRAMVYFTEDGFIDSDQEQRFERAGDGSLVIRLIRAQPPPRGLGGLVTGVVIRAGGWETGNPAPALRFAARCEAAE